LLLEHETTWRRQKRFEARARAARLRQSASIEDVDYRAARGLDRALFRKLATCRERATIICPAVPRQVGEKIMKKRVAFCLSAFFFAAAVFWWTDISMTARLKAQLINLLPLRPQAKLDWVRSICAGSFGSNPSAIYTCQINFQSEEAEKQVADDAMRKVRCEWFKKEIGPGGSQSKNWRMVADNNAIYVGNDDHWAGFLFFAEDCEFLSMSMGKRVFKGAE
jgi:hypothetical protein